MELVIRNYLGPMTKEFIRAHKKVVRTGVEWVLNSLKQTPKSVLSWSLVSTLPKETRFKLFFLFVFYQFKNNKYFMFSPCLSSPNLKWFSAIYFTNSHTKIGVGASN